jgi:hypothetical protein
MTGSEMRPNSANPIAITGANVGDFSIVNNTCAGVTVPAQVPAATCTFDVQFNPLASATAARSARVTITPDDIVSAPSVTIDVSGTAQVTVTHAVTGPGLVSPASPQTVNAGGNLVITTTPDAGYFPRILVDGSHQNAAADHTYTFTVLADNHALDIKFVRNGDVVEDGTIGLGDALKALRISLGLDAATPDQKVAADVGPLVASQPKADGSVDVSDALVILRRSINLDPNW